MRGAGVGFLGKIGSGSEGVLPEITQLVEIFGPELGNILKMFVLDTFETSYVDPRMQSSLPFFDFPNTEALLKKLFDSRDALFLLRERISLIVDGCTGFINTNEQPINVKLRQLIVNVSRLSSAERIKRLREPVVIKGKDNVFEGVVEGFKKSAKSYARSIPGRSSDDAEIERIVSTKAMEALMSGLVRTKKEMVIFMREMDIVPVAGVLPEKDDLITCMPLSCALANGYTGEAAIERAMQYRKGELFISKRVDPYFGVLMQAIEVYEKGVDDQDKSFVLDLINVCLEKLRFI